MEFKMYAVKDELTGKFMQPMFIENTEESAKLAIRQFASNVNNIKLWKDNPNDFSLYLVGVFDDELGAKSSYLEKVVSGRSVIDG